MRNLRTSLVFYIHFNSFSHFDSVWCKEFGTGQQRMFVQLRNYIMYPVPEGDVRFQRMEVEEAEEDDREGGEGEGEGKRKGKRAEELSTM